MKAVRIKVFGGPEQLEMAEIPSPAPTAGEVLIRVAAAGVNRPDLLQRQGKYPPPPGVTDIPGLEVAGVIVESQSPEWQPGQKVCALLAGGGYAAYAVAPAGQCLPVPDNLSMTEAAALPEAVFTVYNNLFARAQLAPGETVLIHGGSSGIGTTAIQMARTYSARVIVTAGSDEKCAACAKLGAALAINYKTCDFVTEVRNFAGEAGVNVVLDMVGGPYVPRSLELLADQGRHVSIAHLQGAETTVNIREIMIKRLTLTGSTLRARSVAEKQALRDAIRREVWPWIDSGKLRPVIHATFPLREAAAAHTLLETGTTIGKIVLTAGEENPS